MGIIGRVHEHYNLSSLIEAKPLVEKVTSTLEIVANIPLKIKAVFKCDEAFEDIKKVYEVLYTCFNQINFEFLEKGDDNERERVFALLNNYNIQSILEPSIQRLIFVMDDFFKLLFNVSLSNPYEKLINLLKRVIISYRDLLYSFFGEINITTSIEIKKEFKIISEVNYPSILTEELNAETLIKKYVAPPDKLGFIRRFDEIYHKKEKIDIFHARLVKAVSKIDAGAFKISSYLNSLDEASKKAFYKNYNLDKVLDYCYPFFNISLLFTQVASSIEKYFSYDKVWKFVKAFAKFTYETFNTFAKELEAISKALNINK